MTNKLSKNYFVEIFEANIGIIYKISKAYTKTTADRDDLINDIALELWKAFPRFKGHAKISTWIYRIALNTSMNYKRRQKKEISLFSDLKQIDNISTLIDNEDNSNIDLLYNCIEDLDEINKAIIILYLDNNSHDEISEITGISKTNVGTRISRIKEQLRKSVNKKK
jgi:RNA polymerase sigma-70 factor (ECF subfamily)